MLICGFMLLLRAMDASQTWAMQARRRKVEAIPAVMVITPSQAMVRRLRGMKAGNGGNV